MATVTNILVCSRTSPKQHFELISTFGSSKEPANRASVRADMIDPRARVSASGKVTLTSPTGRPTGESNVNFPGCDGRFPITGGRLSRYIL